MGGLAPGAIVLTGGEVWRHALGVRALAQLQVPPGTLYVQTTEAEVSARINAGIREALGVPKVAWVWIMGDNHVYAADVLTRLLAHGVPVVAPTVASTMPPFRVMPTTVAGLLVRRAVLEAMTAPWFTPDGGFFSRCAALGIPILTDGDLRIGHLATMCVYPHRFPDGVWGSLIHLGDGLTVPLRAEAPEREEVAHGEPADRRELA